MPRKSKSFAKHGDHDNDITIDVKTARRMLAWVNAANLPEDLMRPPEAWSAIGREVHLPH